MCNLWAPEAAHPLVASLLRHAADARLSITGSHFSVPCLYVPVVVLGWRRINAGMGTGPQGSSNIYHLKKRDNVLIRKRGSLKRSTQVGCCFQARQPVNIGDRKSLPNKEGRRRHGTREHLLQSFAKSGVIPQWLWSVSSSVAPDLRGVFFIHAFIFL